MWNITNNGKREIAKSIVRTRRRNNAHHRTEHDNIHEGF